MNKESVCTEPRPLDGRVVAITGGAGGIGEATAQALRAAQARVVIGDVDEVAGKATADRLGLEGFVPLDVTDPASFAEFLRQSESTAGPLDALVNNAGIMPVGPLLDEDELTARRVIDINVHGVIIGTKLAVLAMRERGSGHIVNIASMAGVASVPGLATYNASKFAVVGFTDAVRLEVQSLGIDVSAILPYFVDTELAAGTNGPRGFKKAEPKQVAEAIVATLERPAPRRPDGGLAMKRLRYVLEATERSAQDPRTQTNDGLRSAIERRPLPGLHTPILIP